MNSNKNYRLITQGEVKKLYKSLPEANKQNIRDKLEKLHITLNLAVNHIERIIEIKNSNANLCNATNLKLFLMKYTTVDEILYIFPSKNYSANKIQNKDTIYYNILEQQGLYTYIDLIIRNELEKNLKEDLNPNIVTDLKEKINTDNVEKLIMTMEQDYREIFIKIQELKNMTEYTTSIPKNFKLEDLKGICSSTSKDNIDDFIQKRINDHNALLEVPVLDNIMVKKELNLDSMEQQNIKTNEVKA